jgi:hypothetical protein
MEYSSSGKRLRISNMRTERLGSRSPRKDNGVGADLLHIRKPHPARNALGLGLVGGRGDNTTLLAANYRTTFKLGMDRLLAGSEERVGIDVEDGLGPGRDGEGLGSHRTSKNFYREGVARTFVSAARNEEREERSK